MGRCPCAVYKRGKRAQGAGAAGGGGALLPSTSTRSGAAELVIENDAGFVCDARDVDALTGHLRALLDPGTRAGLGDSARRAVEPLTPAAMTLKLVLLYKELLEVSIAHKLAARAVAARQDTKTDGAPLSTGKGPDPTATATGSETGSETADASDLPPAPDAEAADHDALPSGRAGSSGTEEPPDVPDAAPGR